MAACLTGRVMMTRQRWLLLLLSALASAASAQNLPDPTRPPAEISSNGSASSGRGGRPLDNGLQSIFISPGRRAAIINGQTVELGAKYGNARLIEVNERSVVLQGKQGRQMLALFPGVQLKMKGAAQPAGDLAAPIVQKKKKNKLDSMAAQPAAPEEEK